MPHDGEKDENLVLEIRPNSPQEMLIPCLWSDWHVKGESDLSFADIRDDPPVEITLAGHDRCIISIKPEYIEAWLAPEPANLAAQYTIQRLLNHQQDMEGVIVR